MATASPQSSPDLTPEQLRELAGQKLAVAAAMAEAAKRGLLPDGTRMSRVIGPQTDEELLDAVEGLTGYHIPRVAVCTQHDHVAPSKTFCDLYFERVFDVLWIGNRGGGKTTNSGFLHGAKSRYLPQYTTAIAGAVEKQGYRAYAEFKRFTRNLGAEIIDSLLSKTTWVHGSENEVLGGTVRQLNGPHPNLAQLDEVELALVEAYQEFLNMAQGNRRYAGQQLLTSTRKRAYGLVQSIVKEVQLAIRQGDEPPWRIDIFCVFETMAPVTNCREAPQNADRPESELCQCNKVRKGQWPDGTARTFDKVCGGRAYRSDGFVHLRDVTKRFRQLSRNVWEAQQECLQPDVEGLVHKWIQPRHRLAAWYPHPSFGVVYRGWDWGGNNPHAVVWCQLLEFPIGLAWQTVRRQDGAIVDKLTPIVTEDDKREPVQIIPEGALVQFDEVYGTSDEIGQFSDLGIRVAIRQAMWARYGFDFQIGGDFCDPAGLVAKREVRKAVKAVNTALSAYGKDHVAPDVQDLATKWGVELEGEDGPIELYVPTFKSLPAPRYESIQKHIEWGEDERIYLVPTMCPGTDDEFDVYHWIPPKEGQNAPEDAAKEDDHAMDGERYLIWHLTRMEDRPSAGQPAGEPRAVPEPPRSQGPLGPPQVELSQSPVAAAGREYFDGDPTASNVRGASGPGIRGVAGRQRIR